MFIWTCFMILYATGMPNVELFYFLPILWTETWATELHNRLVGIPYIFPIYSLKISHHDSTYRYDTAPIKWIEKYGWFKGLIIF